MSGSQWSAEVREEDQVEGDRRAMQGHEGRTAGAACRSREGPRLCPRAALTPDAPQTWPGEREKPQGTRRELEGPLWEPGTEEPCSA